MKRILLIILLLGVYGHTVIHAQTPAKVSIEGIVTEYDTKEPLPGSVVTIPQFSLWAVTDENGKFRLASVPTGTYDLEVTYLGYEKLIYNINVTSSVTGLNLKIKALSLALSSVTVTATKGSDLNSSVRIDRQAMEHVRASTVKDFMALLPGTVTQNSSLSTPQIISLRDIDGLGSGSSNLNTTNARGVGFVVDGARVSNDAYVSNWSGATVTGSPQSRTGFDTRRIATDDIESIEVITGVASAAYGEMTSGAVIITSKSGRTPLEVVAAIDPNSKVFTLNKGFGLGKERGTLNMNLGYAKAYRDPRTDMNSYGRESFSLRYANTFNQKNTPLRLTASVSGYISAGDTKRDPDNIGADNFDEYKDKNLSFNLNTNWMLNKPWITNLRFTGSFNSNNNDVRRVTNYGTSAVSDFIDVAMENGVNIIRRQVSGYTADLRDQSKGLTTIMKLDADLSERYGSIFNKFLIGVEWNSLGNQGRGYYYEGMAHSNVRNIDMRDYIPFINKLFAYAEDKVTIPVNNNKNSIVLSAGARFMYLFADVVNQKMAVDPRLNVRYTLIQNKNTNSVSHLAIRGGWGIQTVLPSLADLYSLPDFKSQAELSWDGTELRQPGRLSHTYVTTPDMMRNPDLKFQRSTNFEVGVEFGLFGITGSVVYWNEKIRNGFSESHYILYQAYKNYTLPNTVLTEPYFDSAGQLVYGDQATPVPFTNRYRFERISYPDNNAKIDKWGVDYVLDFGQIKPIRTSIVMNGQFLLRNTSDDEGLLRYNTWNSTRIMVNGVPQQDNPFVVAFNGATARQSGKKEQMLTNKLNFITHIPKLRIITTVTIQGVLMRKEQSQPSPGWYHLDQNGNPVYGDYSNGGEVALYRDPAFYMDKDKVLTPFVRTLYDDPNYGQAFLQYRQTQINARYFLQDSFNPYFMAKVGVTKEIGNIAQLSFSASNFTFSNPQMLRQSDGTAQRMNSDFFFSAELKLKF